MQDLLDVKQACSALGISRAMLNRLIAEGELTIVKLGKRTLFRETDLENLVARNVRRRTTTS